MGSGSARELEHYICHHEVCRRIIHQHISLTHDEPFLCSVLSFFT